MSSQIVQPGPSLVRGATALEQRRLQLGQFPYQWLFPGPRSRHVLQTGSSAITGAAVPAQLITQYTVSDGMQFVLRGIVVGILNPTGWTEGGTNFTFTLTVTSGGTRQVEFMNAFNTHIGALEAPYPVLGRLEFESNSVLKWTFANDGTVTAGKAFAHLVGYEYPQIEEAY